MSAPSICGLDGSAGKGSDGAAIRVYTKTECESKNGLYHSNGECSYPTGGSISWDCRSVNDDPMAMLYQYRYYIGGAAVAGGLLYWRSMSMRR